MTTSLQDTNDDPAVRGLQIVIPLKAGVADENTDTDLRFGMVNGGIPWNIYLSDNADGTDNS